MSAGIRVDYFGEGKLYDAFHPLAELAYIEGKIKLPEDITLSFDVVSWDYTFTLPEPILNPFLFCTVAAGIDYHFTTEDASTGTWTLHLVGQYSHVAVGSSPLQVSRNFTIPVGLPSGHPVYILYGGFRGG